MQINDGLSWSFVHGCLNVKLGMGQLLSVIFPVSRINVVAVVLKPRSIFDCVKSNGVA